MCLDWFCYYVCALNGNKFYKVILKLIYTMLIKLCIYIGERTVSLFGLTKKEGKDCFILLLVND